MSSCPETLDLLESLEGRVDLGAHLAGCLPCREALADLRGVLALEASAVPAPSALETERALASVMGRARMAERRRWGATAFFSAAAALTLALLIPAGLVGGSPGAGGGPGLDAVVAPNTSIETSIRPDTTGLGPQGKEFVEKLTRDSMSGVSSLGIIQSQVPAAVLRK